MWGPSTWNSRHQLKTRKEKYLLQSGEPFPTWRGMVGRKGKPGLGRESPKAVPEKV